MQAVQASGVLDSIQDPTRFGIYLGSGEGNQDFLSFTNMMTKALTADGEFDLKAFTKIGLETLNPLLELGNKEPNMLASLFGRTLQCPRLRQLPQHARGEQLYDRRSDGDDSPGRCRCDARVVPTA
ncbi:MAG: hypothetical protein R3B96_11835 [Pirellulaceae bacterium]